MHPDFIPEEATSERDGWQRVATVLVYLNDVASGGETVFPNGLWKDAGRLEGGARASDCARGVVHARPVLGDAILFWSLDTTNDEDMRSFHAGCPVVEGEKWVMTNWFHLTAFRAQQFSDSLRAFRWKIGEAVREARPGVGGCADGHEMCHDWALADACHHVEGVLAACCESCARFDAGELK